MELFIGENIRRFRREKNLTQEEVAAHLGVSFQSVSKWERNEGYPDITLLPAIANYFGVTVDDLLGVNEMAAQKRYEEINRTWEENRREGKHEENVALMKESLKTFPNDSLLLVQLAASLHHMGDTAEEKRKYTLEAVAVEEQILKYSGDSEVRGATMYNICFSYDKLGWRDKAIEQAKKLPNLYKARENALVYFLAGEEKREVSRSALEPLAWAIKKHLCALAETEANEEWRTKADSIVQMLEEA